jgi:hypothetical protein
MLGHRTYSRAPVSTSGSTSSRIVRPAQKKPADAFVATVAFSRRGVVDQEQPQGAAA